MQHYSNLDEKDVTDNKAFWKKVKPFLSDRIMYKGKITLIKEDEIVSNDEEKTQVFNTFFSNVLVSFNIPDNNDPIIKLIVKYRNHLSILTVGLV